MGHDINDFVKSESEFIDRLKGIVQKSVDEQRSVMESLLNPPKEILTSGQRISDKVARFGGSWAFIISFFLILIIWICYNTIAPHSDDFDPYPFILMNLVLSCIAALQAPVIMMSQNRQEEKDRMRSQNDYMINLKAEIELRALQQKVDLLIEDQIKTLFESQAKQMEILERIEAKLGS